MAFCVVTHNDAGFRKKTCGTREKIDKHWSILCVDIFELVTIGAVEDLGYFVLFLLEELVIFWFCFFGR